MQNDHVRIHVSKTNLATLLKRARVVLAVMKLVLACEGRFMEFIDSKKWLQTGHRMSIKLPKTKVHRKIKQKLECERVQNNGHSNDDTDARNQCQ